MKLTGTGVLALAGLAVGAVLALAFLRKFGPGGLDPTSPDNAAYTSANAVGAALTGDQDFSLGVWLYELTHSSEPDPSTPVYRREYDPLATVASETAPYFAP